MIEKVATSVGGGINLSCVAGEEMPVPSSKLVNDERSVLPRTFFWLHY